MNENTETTGKLVAPWQYVTKVSIYHVVTYIVCGIIFSSLFNYSELFSEGCMAYYMHPVASTNTLMGPLFQVVRGVLFGLVLLLLRDYIRTEKLGFLKLFSLMLVFGIINTPGPALSSIEGMIYTKVPWIVHLKGAPEIVVQTFLFSWWVSTIDKRKKQMSIVVRKAFIATIICVVGYSLCGIIIAAIQQVDVSSEASNIQSYITLAITGVLCFALTYWYIKKQTARKPIYAITYYGALYAICAAYPAIHNMVTDSSYQTPLAFVICGLPIVVIAIYLEKKKKITTFEE